MTPLDEDDIPYDETIVDPTNKDIYDLLGNMRRIVLRQQRVIAGIQTDHVELKARVTVVEKRVDATDDHEMRIHRLEKAIVKVVGDDELADAS